MKILHLLLWCSTIGAWPHNVLCRSIKFESNKKALSVPPGSVNKRISFWVSKGYLKDLGDGKFKSIEPNEEILEIGKDENEETPEQLELERKRAEQEQNFEVRSSIICGPFKIAKN